MGLADAKDQRLRRRFDEIGRGQVGLFQFGGLSGSGGVRILRVGVQAWIGSHCNGPLPLVAVVAGLWLSMLASVQAAVCAVRSLDLHSHQLDCRPAIVPGTVAGPAVPRPVSRDGPPFYPLFQPAWNSLSAAISAPAALVELLALPARSKGRLLSGLLILTLRKVMTSDEVPQMRLPILLCGQSVVARRNACRLP